MEKIFKHILVPVPFNSQTNSIVEKSIGIASHLRCDIHFIHITSTSFLSRLCSPSKKDAEKKFKMAEIQRYANQHLLEGLKISTSLHNGDPEPILTDYALKHDIDTILLNAGRNRFPFSRSPISINRLAHNTGCFVLTFRSNAVFDGIKTIVLPIAASLPINKIRVATYLAKQFNACIHLVAVGESGEADDKHAYLKKAFQVLKDNTDLQIICRSLQGETESKKLLQYASSVNAGLLVVDPGTEAISPRFVDRLRPTEFTIPVITVS